MRKLAGFLMVFLGILLALWIGYNIFVERLPVTEGRDPLAALLLSIGLVYVGQKWFRRRREPEDQIFRDKFQEGIRQRTQTGGIKDPLLSDMTPTRRPYMWKGVVVSRTLYELIQPVVKNLRNLWIVLTSSMVLYVPVVYLHEIKTRSTGGAEGLFSKMGQIFAVFAALLAFISILQHRYLLCDKRLRGHLMKKVDLNRLATNARNGEIVQSKLRKLEDLNSWELKLLNITRFIYIPLFIGLVMNNLVVILGVLLSLSTSSFNKFLPFLLVGLFLNLMILPRVTAVIQRTQHLIQNL